MNWKWEKEEEDSEIKWYVLLLLLIILLLIIITLVMIFRRGKLGGNNTEANVPDGNVSGGVGLVIDPNAENNPSYDNNNDAEQGVTIAGRKSITIPANKKEVSVDFYNPIENAELYYLTFELRLYNGDEQDYEVLYTSGLVAPGKYINRIKLSRELKKGVYDAVIHVQPYRMDDEKTLTNNADLKISLIVN